VIPNGRAPIPIDKKTVYIVHVAQWSDEQTNTKGQLNQQLASSTWAAYEYGKPALKPLRFDFSGNPVIYNRKVTWVIGISSLRPLKIPRRSISAMAFRRHPPKSKTLRT
jgi:hypothetical protein